MYAGIGYYTLPALVNGNAKFVLACEWNAYAANALRYNLKTNGVEKRAMVLQGDCRVTLKALMDRFDNNNNNNNNKSKSNNNNSGEYAVENDDDERFDRISLGLLPSSEGGWPTAVSCLRRTTGGWLHVHANVPTAERTEWTHWLCRSLVRIAAVERRRLRVVVASSSSDEEDDDCSDWVAVCHHIERVKSFAPKVDHVVADVFVGPRNSPKMPLLDGKSCPATTTGVIDSAGFTATPLDDVFTPSCALDEQGILHQNWMRENSSSI